MGTVDHDCIAYSNAVEFSSPSKTSYKQLSLNIVLMIWAFLVNSPDHLWHFSEQLSMHARPLDHCFVELCMRFLMVYGFVHQRCNGDNLLSYKGSRA